jgi:hypothetical protein
MTTPKAVLKCRECGEIRPASYGADKHSRIDGCDGPLDPYCSKCCRFLASDGCSQCESNARIERVLSTPGLAIAYSLLRHWPWFRTLSDDFIDRAGITARSKREVVSAAGLAAVAMCAPAWMRVLLWILIAASVLFVCTTPTVSHKESGTT